ncbi:hypothetical protein ECH_0926 [Ehrlichia chaffeensis str. Arkansas]|uniref:Uncharacterized protein n=1 Tax=Ehrlichia chaffeensis (strain ATCC CRL-10679 / Arkansas) TaxID=205920 RepID=Q2GFR7_EHRCR|nr:hypothetical protein ECH_0924 [Ehrlichia chaffeensis str. Arkansas]ABD45007.1 hypothetical protein ECH_0926 [Ehrlichia chaffeensis str. Arkansas]
MLDNTEREYIDRFYENLHIKYLLLMRVLHMG